MKYEDLIKERYSVRKFDSRKVEDELLNKVLEAGRIAPSAKNMQPLRIYVASSLKSISDIDTVTPCRYNAPIVLIVCANKDESDIKYHEIDASIMTTHMMLEAFNIGLGSIWIEMFDKDKLKEVFSLPSNIEPISLLPIGYIDKDCKVDERHYIRKELKDIVKYL